MIYLAFAERPCSSQELMQMVTINCHFNVVLLLQRFTHSSQAKRQSVGGHDDLKALVVLVQTQLLLYIHGNDIHLGKV